MSMTSSYLGGVSAIHSVSANFVEITDRNESLNESEQRSTQPGSKGVDDVSAETVVKATILVLIITTAVIGNALVIISVARFDKLRIIANTFIVSLASADLLVALLVMPFSASQEIAEGWLFNEFTCDLFNANDVLFCTASLLHLCCISMDRYIAITDPFGYDRRMTRRRVAITLGVVWTASTLISHVPVHSKWYVKEGHRESIEDGHCFFNVNMPYGIVSSGVSFWTPALVMVFTYIKIYREARRQEKLIEAMTHIHGRRSTLGPDHSLPVTRTVSGQGVGMATGGGWDNRMVVFDRGGSAGDLGYGQNGGGGGVQGKNSVDERTRRLTCEGRKMKREHKAAKTLGIIMGAFLVCWLPFFTWYLTDSICQEMCAVPQVCISALFWIGYTNSALNPVIYACFNRDFRFAFKKLLGCCLLVRRSSQQQYITTSERTALKMSPITRNGISKV